MPVPWEIVLLAITIVNITNYFSIREIIWSIVWLNKGGKLHKFIEFKKSVRLNESLLSRISMRYLGENVSICQRDFIAWRTAKYIFACVEIIMEILYFIVGLIEINVSFFRYFTLFMVTQAVLSSLILRFHLGWGRHLTKYDRMRMKR